MERVKKGEKYWYLDLVYLDVIETQEMNNGLDNFHYRKNNYFATKGQAIAMATKLRAVLNGADVIEMPSEEELREAEDNYIGHPFEIDEGATTSMCRTAFGAGIGWLLQSKIVK